MLTLEDLGGLTRKGEEGSCIVAFRPGQRLKVSPLSDPNEHLQQVPLELRSNCSDPVYLFSLYNRLQYPCLIGS